MKDIANLDWSNLCAALNSKGFAKIPSVLTKQECTALSGLYADNTLYRNVINMQRYRFGRGEYKYFGYPLPSPVQQIREALYSPLARIANTWMQSLSLDITFPENHEEFLANCKAHHQDRPTPLILRYEAGGYNTLHQDLYGEVYFPFQVVLVLTQKRRGPRGRGIGAG